MSLPCYEYAKEFALQQVVPFLDYFKKHVQTADDTIVKEVAEFKEIHYALEDEYKRCVLENKNLIIEKKHLLIKNDSLIANCLEKDICSIVLASDIVVPPSSNCLCEELRSNCDREHSKVAELEAEILKKQQMLHESEKCCAFIENNHVNLQVKFQKYKECLQNQMVCDNTNSTASNVIFEINKLKDQLQGKDDTIRNLQTQINITRMLNVGSTVGSFDKQTLETELSQLKDALTSVRIQLDSYKVENVNLKRRYEELSNSNTYSRSTFTAKINALTAENAKLKTELISKISSGPTASEKPKVLTSGMYTNSSKYVSPPKRANWVKPTPLPKKKKSVNTKTPQAKHSVNHTKKVWKATRNHNVNTTKTAWRPTGKVVGSVKPQWKPTGRHFALYDNCPLTRIMEPIVEPLELTPSVSSSSKVTMISRFPDCKLSDRKAGSKGISVGRTVADSSTARLKRATTYVFRWFDLSLLSRSSTRTASIQESGTLVLEDLKALSWKTCQEGSLLNLSDHRVGVKAPRIFALVLLEHQDVVLEFRSPSRWKELSKEMSSEILPSGDGSHGEMFKLIASLITKEKLK
ncbi:hypothetical protein Tco_0450795 [Tanacetum coccineum]